MRKTLIFSGLALALASGLALAQQAGAGHTDHADHAGHAGHAGHGGQGGHATRHAEHQARMDARFAEADKDGNGRLDKVEAQAMGERFAGHFDRMDANRDGGIEKAELVAARERMRQGREGRHGMGGRMAYHRGLFKGMDDDGDEAISRAELGNKVPMLVEAFDTVDANRDGKLSKEEMMAHHRAMHGAPRAGQAGQAD